MRWTYQALNSSDTTKVKRSKVKVTRSNENCAQNIEYMPKTSSDSGKYTRLIGNRGRRSEWLGHIFDRKLQYWPFLRMRSENMSKSLLTTYHIAKILSPL